MVKTISHPHLVWVHYAVADFQHQLTEQRWVLLSFKSDSHAWEDNSQNDTDDGYSQYYCEDWSRDEVQVEAGRVWYRWRHVCHVAQSPSHGDISYLQRNRHLRCHTYYMSQLHTVTTQFCSFSNLRRIQVANTDIVNLLWLLSLCLYILSTYMNVRKNNSQSWTGA